MPKDNVFTYWKADPNAPERVIGGCCRAKDLPPYAIEKDVDLPTQIDVNTGDRTCADTKTFTSPPIFGGRYVYRYRMVLTSSSREEIAGITDLWDFFLHLRAERMEGPVKDARRTNWWWSEQNGHWRSCQAPLRLIIKWAGPMMDVVTRDCGCEAREELLALQQERVDRHKNSNRAKNASSVKRRHYGKKRDGTLVIAPHAIAFSGGTMAQVFTLKPFGRRDQLGPHDTRGVRYRVPAKSMHPVHPDWLEEISAPGPVGHLALLAAKLVAQTSATSAHDHIKIAGAYDGAILDWGVRAKDWYAETTALCSQHLEMTEALHVRFAALRVCEKIFVDYLLELPMEQRTRHRDEINSLMECFRDLEAPICEA